jgi:hypothetical protein
MLTQSTLHFRSSLSRGRLLVVLATAGLALTGAAPAGAAFSSFSYTKVEWTYTKQQADGTSQVAAQATTPPAKAS